MAGMAKQDLKKKMLVRSERVKCVDLHTREPWVLCSLSSGQVNLYNYETASMIKSFDVIDRPIRCVKFIQRMNWFICGTDDLTCKVYNYNTMEKVKEFEAHQDYIRGVAVHETLPLVLTSSDDMTIKMWDWEKNWANTMLFDGHVHYVMAVTFNPKDSNTFATASLDCTVKVWNRTAFTCNFTLEGHTQGVNCVEYYPGGDKPYLISGSDDHTVKIWDYQTKACVHTLEGHTHNVVSCIFFPDKPLIITGSEDESMKIWQMHTYRLIDRRDYGLERVWALNAKSGSNKLAIGCDKGTVVLSIGKEEPVFSMDLNAKIVFAQNQDIVQLNLKGNVGQLSDGERLILPQKDQKEMGTCESVPKRMEHNSTGTLVAVVFEGEYTINSSLTWRPKAFGNALDFVWANEANTYAILDSSSCIQVFKNFKEKGSYKVPFAVDRLFGGPLLGVRDKKDAQITFYDWETFTPIRQIAIQPRAVYWNEAGESCAVITETSFYILRYNKQQVQEVLESGQAIPEDGIDDAFDLISEVDDRIRGGQWVGDCFIFVNRSQRLNYFMGGQVTNVAVLETPMYLLGYIARDNRVYLTDKKRNIVSYQLFHAVLEYQNAVVRGDVELASREYLPKIPESQKSKVAHFLDAQGYYEEALNVATEEAHRFNLTILLHRLDIATEIARKSEEVDKVKWKQIGDLALQYSDFKLAAEALTYAEDYNGLLLLYSSLEDRKGLHEVATKAYEKNRFNVAFTAFYMLGDVKKCTEVLTETGRIPEAALFARSRCPELIPEVVVKWKKSLGASKLSQAIADPSEYPNLFPEIAEVFKKKTEKHADPVEAQPEEEEEEVEKAVESPQQPISPPKAAEPPAPASPPKEEVAPPAPKPPSPEPESPPKPASPAAPEEEEEEEDFGVVEEKQPSPPAADAPAPDVDDLDELFDIKDD